MNRPHKRARLVREVVASTTTRSTVVRVWRDDRAGHGQTPTDWVTWHRAGRLVKSEQFTGARRSQIDTELAELIASAAAFDMTVTEPPLPKDPILFGYSARFG